MNFFVVGRTAFLMIKLSTFKKITRSKSLAKTRPVNYSTIRTKILIRYYFYNTTEFSTG